MSYGMPQSRQEAKQMGADRYNGKPCKVCEGTLRYLSNGGCVHCQSMRGSRHDATHTTNRGGGDPERKNNALAWKEAQREGVPMYNRVSPCPKCMDEGRGLTVLRYTSTGGCVACLKARSDRKYRELAGYDVLQTLPIRACAKSCHHGKELRALFPELNGDTLIYVKHQWGGEITGDKPHYGKCMFCHPNRAITLHNKMVREGGMPPDLAQAGRWLAVSMTPRPDLGFPHGYLSHCMASYNAQHRGNSSPATFAPLRLPVDPPLVQSMANNLKRIFDED